MERKNREKKERMGKEGEDGKRRQAAFFPLSLTRAHSFSPMHAHSLFLFLSVSPLFICLLSSCLFPMLLDWCRSNFNFKFNSTFWQPGSALSCQPKNLPFLTTFKIQFNQSYLGSKKRPVGCFIKPQLSLS